MGRQQTVTIRRTMFWRLLAVIALIGLAIASGGSNVSAKSAVYDRIDVDLTLLQNGDFNVIETQHVSFSGGSFTHGHRTLPLVRTTGIDNVAVSEMTPAGTLAYTKVQSAALDRADGQYVVTSTADNVQIDWRMSNSSATQRTFLVSYVVHGALRDYPAATPANQQIWWTGVGSSLSSQNPVKASTFTVHLPRAVDLANTHVGEDGLGKAADFSHDGQTFTFNHGTFSSGDSMTVRVIFPPIIAGIQAPPWQASDDAARAEAANHKQRLAKIALISIGATLVILIGGGLLLYLLWYTKGRDPHTGLVASFLATPPSDLSPGVAGALLDERADEQDVVATFLDLARRGIMTMTDAGLSGEAKQPTGTDYQLTIVQVGAAFTPYETTIIQAAFGTEKPAEGSTTGLGQAGPKLRESFPKVKTQLYQALVDRGLFVQSPEETRDRWKRTTGLLQLGFVLAGTVVGFSVSWFLTIPCMAAALVAFAARFLGRSMPQKTEKGAEEAAKWRAFRQYLKDIDKYEHLTEKSAIFERYLAYTVAFGLEVGWVSKFRAAGTPVPAWIDGGYHSGPFGGAFPPWIWGPSFGPQGSSGNGGGGVGLPDVHMPGMPDVQSMSNKVGGGVQSTSTGLMSLLNLAGVILEVVSSVSGGGSGGSSGGGGGGFD